MPDRGRPTHEDTQENHALVAQMAVAGCVQGTIARVLGISEPTLRKHYGETLDLALEKTISSVSSTLVQKALNGDTTSAIFFLKVRGKKHGWTERQEVTGPDGEPLFDVSKLSTQALAEIMAAASEAGQSDD